MSSHIDQQFSAILEASEIHPRSAAADDILQECVRTICIDINQFEKDAAKKLLGADQSSDQNE